MAAETTIPEIKNPGKATSIFFGVGVVALLVLLIGLRTNPVQFWASGLLGFSFWVTLGLGGWLFVLIHHAAGSIWSNTVRRMSESVMVTLPWLFLFAIPLLIWGLPHLFEWTKPEVVSADPILQGKAGYLNTSFFSIRTVFYFAVWLIGTQLLYRYSIKQDAGDPHGILSKKLRVISAPSIFLFAGTITFFGFDWLMSLDPLWYSTIFGVYIFSGSYLVILAFLILLNLQLRKTEGFDSLVTIEHYHDLGKLLFAFVVFWGYIGGSQYFFIWYANIPEETVWYLQRWESGWKWVSMIMVFGHFAVPFMILVFRAAKRNLRVLGFVAAWVFLMHLVDLYWLIMPTFHPHVPVVSWMDIAAFIGVGGIFLGLFWRNYTAHPLIPIGDPKLKDSIEFINA